MRSKKLRNSMDRFAAEAARAAKETFLNHQDPGREAPGFTNMLQSINVLQTEHFNYGTWQRGDKVASSGPQRCDYWHGENEIRETPRWYYLLLMGTANYRGTKVFTHFVHRVAKETLAGEDLQLLAENLHLFQLSWSLDSLEIENRDWES